MPTARPIGFGYVKIMAEMKGVDLSDSEIKIWWEGRGRKIGCPLFRGETILGGRGVLLQRGPFPPEEA